MSDSDEYQVASPEQKLNIATYFMMSSPAGEIDEVVADVRKLVSDSKTLNPAALSNILRDYNTEQMTSAKDLNGEPVLVTKYGQVKSDEYLDPATGKVLQFDHNSRTFIRETDKKQQLSPEVDKYRRAISAAITTYISNLFKPHKCVSAVYGADNDTITICMSAKNVNLGNYWTGSWRSVYSLNIRGSGQTELKGNVKINVHYFEDGNVQLNTVIDHRSSVSKSDPETCAKQVTESIEKFETEFQNNLEEMYVNMHRTTFKAMRRFLPVSRVKFTWTSAAHSLASEVNKQ